MPLRVVPLGGLGEIGLNSMLFDDGESALLIDAGLMFPDDTMLGIDYVIPDFDVLREVAPRLKGLLLTHGHEDHIGAVSFLLKEFDVPVHGTPLTLGLLRHRLEEYDLDGAARLVTIGRSERFRLGSFDIEAFPVCHSIPDGVGYILRCGEGVFVHTGDFKIDPRPPDGVPTAVARLARLASEERVTALFSDSTNVEREGHSLPEAFVGEALSEIFGDAQGRVIVAMFSSNIHRIQGVLTAAARHGRRVALCGRSMVRNVATALDLGCMKLPRPDVLLPVEEAETLPDRSVVVLTTGSQGEPRSALTLMALGEHKHVRVREGDTAVLSSKFIPGNERAIASVINHLFLAGAEVLHERISEVHVSGHASREELKIMIGTVRPKIFIPIHGDPRFLFRHRNLAREMDVPHSEVALNGDILEFSGGELARAGKLAVGRFFVDGKGVGDVESFILKDRYQLSQVGMVMVVLVLSSTTGEILYGPDILTRGVVTENGSEASVEEARGIVLKTWEDSGVEARKDLTEIQTDIRKALRRYFNKRLERKPVILPVVLEL
ncbi:MAG: ribonuclease J [Deltaproteobacteria bacterium RBG_16_64_85]|nr:MAG: ribonuclease J [Deltaproteobacteria bacterium RBG_16_64_85]